MRRKQIARTRQKRVLVIEDDTWNRWVMRDVLSDEGYAVIEAADGRTGVHLVDEYSPNIVLLDVAMPEFTGVDVLHHLRSRRRTRTLPVLIVSAYPFVLAKQDEASVAGILVKPVPVEELLETVRWILDPDKPAESACRLIEASAVPSPDELDALNVSGLAQACARV
jgi:DNA-binding response OmpR family regulator